MDRICEQKMSEMFIWLALLILGQVTVIESWNLKAQSRKHIATGDQ